LLFIDGFDVMSVRTAQKVLTQFLRRIEGKSVKLVMTCKTDWWENFLRFDDANATFFNARVFRTENEGSISLDEFDAQEFYSLLEKYRTFYHYFGPFEGEVYEACKRNPFLLRIMFEVAAGKRLSYIGYVAIDFYKDFFQQQNHGVTNSYLPLDLKKLKEYVLYKIAHHVLTTRCLERTLPMGNVEESWEGSVRSRSLRFTYEERADLEEQAWTIARNGENLSAETHFNQASDYGKFLLNDIENLEKMGITAIANMPLIAWYDTYGSEIPFPLQWDTESQASLEKLAVIFYKSFLDEYTMLVKQNFPTFYQDFSLCQRMPLRCLIAVGCENKPLPFVSSPEITVFSYTDRSLDQIW